MQTSLPMIKRLFEKSKAMANRHTAADDVQQAAMFKLESVFRTHGEALVEALEEAASSAGQDWLEQQLKLAKLLSTLEKEAGGV